METTDFPSQETVVHTISEHATDSPYVILIANGDQSEYTRRLEEPLAELERTVESLVVEKAELANDEGPNEASSSALPLNDARETNGNAEAQGSTTVE